MGLDIKDIKARLKNAYCDSLGYEEALAGSCNDVASLIDELTELRANMSEMGRLLVEAKKEGARNAVKERLRERACTVKCLQGSVNTFEKISPVTAKVLAETISHIERELHLKE